MPDTTALVPIDPAELARQVASSKWLPDGMSAADVFCAVVAGSELGLPAMASVRAVHIIKGKPSISSQAMQAIAQGQGWRFRWVRSDSEAATLALWAPGQDLASEPWHVETWDIDRARRAGIAGGSGWKNYPEAMLRARAISSAVRAACPGVALGLYAPEELADLAPEPVRVQPAPKAEPPKADPPPPAEPPPAEERAANGHDPSFTGPAHRRFMAYLDRIGLDYESLCRWLAIDDKPRPSAMPEERRASIVRWLDKPENLARVRAELAALDKPREREPGDDSDAIEAENARDEEVI